MLAARFGVAEGNQENIPDQLNNFLSKISDMAGVETKGNFDILIEDMYSHEWSLLQIEVVLIYFQSICYSISIKQSDILFVWCRVPAQTSIDKSIKAT